MSRQVLTSLGTHTTAVVRSNMRGMSTAPHVPTYTEFMSRLTLARKPSPIRELQPLIEQEGMISLGGGMPNRLTFPLTGVSFTTTDGTKLDLNAVELNAALQYSPTPGISVLVKELKALQRREHAPPAAADTAMDLAVCTGSQEALARAFAMLLNPEDTLLIENPTYSGSLAYLKPYGCNLVGTETDGDGLIPDSLERLLDTWEQTYSEKSQIKKPRVLYTIPTGANPSGGTMTVQRRQEVYRIAQAHDLLILEDDPYYYLQFTKDRLPSLFSMDTDARVLRFDSFSKILSSGMRVGTVTGPQTLVQQLCLHTQAVNLHPSGLSQMAVYKLLQHWGEEGFEAHIDFVQSFYLKQRNHFLKSAEKHLTGLAEWSTPSAGMFVWIKLLNVTDSFKLIREKAVDEKVLLIPGNAFSSTQEPSPYVRAAYSTASAEDMDEALARLARLLRANT
eukprot:m.65915 g.65915  ORF g.65915 m.65915 type:complete len:449 (+) comp23618_c0_seq2:179-1525(+)